MRRVTLALAAVMSLLAACRGATPRRSGLAPEYEPPRPGPGEPPSGAWRSAASGGLPFGSVEALARNIDAYMKGFGAHYGEAYAPSGVLVVVHAGRPVLTRQYGKTKPTGSGPPGVQTRFRIASLTKPIVAIAALQLVEEGRLKLDDSVHKWVPELGRAYEPVTVHHLLAQTSGIPAYSAPGALLGRKGEDVAQADVLAWLAKHPPDPADWASEPGPESHADSNSNYYLVGLVIERAAKTTLAERLDKKVFGPAAMRRTGPRPSPEDAAGYARDHRDTLVAADRVASAFLGGAGFLFSTAEDLVALDRALSTTVLLSDAAKEKMWTAVAGDYAYGWVVEQARPGQTILWHSGRTDGYGAFFGRAQFAGVSVVYVGNVGEFDATRVGADVLRMAATGVAVAPPAERDTSAIDEALGRRLAGDFAIEPASRKEAEARLPPQVLATIEGITITWDGRSLSAKPSGQTSFALKQSPDGTLFNPTLGVEIVLDPNLPKAAGGEVAKVRGFVLEQGATSIRYVRGAPKPKPKRPSNWRQGAPPAPPAPSSDPQSSAETGVAPSQGPLSSPSAQTRSPR